MKPFNIEEAKAGKPVCTRDGRPARIVEWNYNPNGICHILAVTIARLGGGTGEAVHSFTNTGALIPDRTSALDLFMAPAQHTVWINLWRAADGALYQTPYLYKTEEDGLNRKGIRPSTSTFIGTFPLTYED